MPNPMETSYVTFRVPKDPVILNPSAFYFPKILPKHYPVVGGGYMAMKAYVSRDDASPAVDYGLGHMHKAFVDSMKAVGDKFKESVSKGFDEAQRKYSDKQSTSMLKGSGTVLEETGRLKRAMKSKDGVQVFDNGATIYLKITWDLPESSIGGLAPHKRADSKFEYIWVHEHGTEKMKVLATKNREIIDRIWELEPRPFFIDSIIKARDEALQTISAQPGHILTQMKQIKGTRVQEFPGISILPFAHILPLTFTEFAFYLAPPSKAYSYLGMAGDLMGAWSGAFTQTAILAYMRQYAWGQAGLTQKTMRRKFRRRVWA